MSGDSVDGAAGDDGSAVHVLRVGDGPAIPPAPSAERRVVVTDVDDVGTATRRIATGEIDCVVTSAATNERDAIGALAGANASVPVVAAVEDPDGATTALQAGATDTCRVDASPTEFARRVRLAVAAAGGSDPDTGGAPEEDAPDPAREGFVAFDDDWEFVEVSDGAGALLERDPDSLAGEVLWEAFPMATDSRIGRKFREAMRTGEDVEFEQYYAPLENWFEVGAYPGSDGDGLYVFFRDISERKRLNEELIAARERTDRMLERVDEAFLALDEDWTLTYVNGRAGEMVGRDPSTLVGKNVWEEFPAASDLAFYEEAARAVETQEPVSFEEYYPPLSMWLEVSVYPDSDGLSVFLRDVTERVKVARRSQHLIEATRDLMAMDRVDDVMSAASEAASDVLGFPGTSFRRYDPEEEVLESVALGSTVGDVEERPSYGVHDSPHGRAFRSGESVIEDIDDEDPFDRGMFTQTMYVPVGEYGVMSVGITEGEFTTTDERLAELLAASTEAALDRASRQERLLEHERTLDAVAGMVYALDSEGRFTLVTGAFADRLGYGREELLGDHVSTVVEGDPAVMLDLPEGDADSVTNETHLLTADGERFPAEVEVSALSGGDDTDGAVGVVRDITELRAAKERFRRERSRFTYLFDNLPDPAVEAELVDGEPVVRQVNEAFESVFGWDADEVVDQRFNDYVLPEDRREEGRELDERIEEGEVATREVRRQTTDGQRYFLYRGVAYDEDEDAGFAIYTDISDRKRRQQYLQVVSRVLRHNLRNALSTIGGYAELLADSVDDPEVAGYARRIVETVEETAELTEDARELRAVVGDEDPERERVDAAAIVRDVVERCHQRYPGAELTASVPPSAPARADEHLERAVQHMVENAIEHNDAATPRVGVEVTVDGENVSIRVEDDGPGIPEHERVVLSGDGEITQLQHGSGLGLWYVRFVAQSCGGSVELAETDLGGTAVVLSVESAG